MPTPYVDLNTDIKPWLGIDVGDTDYDSTLSIMRDSVEQAVINYIENDFDIHVVTNELLDANNSDTVVTRNEPVISVEAIYFGVKTDGSEGILIDTENYYVESGPEGSAIRLRHITTGRGRAVVRVDYTYGYTSLPADIKEAILLSVEAKFRRHQRKSIGLGGRSKKDESESYNGGSAGGWDTKVGLPKDIVSMLNVYRKFEFPTLPMATRNP